MAIESGLSAEANDVMNMMGIMFKNQTQALFDSDYNGFNALLNGGDGVEKKNLDFRASADTGTTLAGNIQFDTLSKWWWGHPTSTATTAVFDEHNDSSVDLALWTIVTSGNGTVTEGAANMVLQAGASSSNGDAKATSIDIWAGGNYILISIPSISAQGRSSGGGTDTGTVRVSIGSQVILTRVSTTVAISAFTNAFVDIIRFPKGNGFVYYFRIDDGTGGGFGAWTTSSETTNVQVQFNAILVTDGAGGQNTVTVDYERYNISTDSGGTVITDAITHTATITNTIGVFNGDSSVGSVAMSISADNGATFESVTDSLIHRFTATGTQFKMKVEVFGASKVNNFAAGYNFY